jgi:hypothetical protein
MLVAKYGALGDEWREEHPDYHYTGYGSEPQTETRCYQDGLPTTRY